MTWKNRIVRYGTEDPSKLVPHPKNWRKHPAKQQEALSAALGEIGWVQDIIINERTGRMLDGHLRVNLANMMNEKSVPVKYVDLSEEEEEAVLATLDPITGMAEADKDRLASILDKMKENFDSLAMRDLAEQIRGQTKLDRTQADDDFEAPPPETIDTDIKLGELIELGAHRLVCGDATSTAHTEILKRAGLSTASFMIVTDPPYGVDYDPQWRRKEGLNKSNRMGTVTNDNRADWSQAFSLLLPADVIYCWHGGKFTAETAQALESSGYVIRAQIIWRKQRIVIGRGDYHWQHEPCWYAVRKGAKSKWCGDRTQSTIWDIDNIHRTGGAHDDEITTHSTQKPVECMARPIRNHQFKTILDPFLGSGTTMIAAERLGRTCYAMEISPEYCEISCQRWEKLTGKERKVVS
jgi:DNA modification methylase